MSSEASHDPSGGSSVDSIEAVDLPDPIMDVVESYEAAGGGRDRFLWQWIYDLLPAFTLSSVPDSRAEEVRQLKTELTVFVTSLDDLAEKDGDDGTFETIYRRVLWPGAEDVATTADVDIETIEFAEELWQRIDGGLRAAPRHEEFRPVFDYDLRQVLNAMDYSRVLNGHPAIANLAGARHYDSHNMVAFPYTDVDVMHSPAFDQADLGATRKVLWDLQEMARIGNWLTTWKREVREGDFSSGVLVYALQHGLVTPGDVETADPDGREALIDLIERYRVEECFEAEWRQLNRRVSERDYETESVDLRALVDGMETVMSHHLASEGHK